MCNPTNIDEVLVQVIHLEASKVKHGMENAYKKAPKFKKWQKGKYTTKNRSIVNKQVDNPTCPHCGKKWHVE